MLRVRESEKQGLTVDGNYFSFECTVYSMLVCVCVSLCVFSVDECSCV